MDEGKLKKAAEAIKKGMETKEKEKKDLPDALRDNLKGLNALTQAIEDWKNKVGTVLDKSRDILGGVGAAYLGYKGLRAGVGAARAGVGAVKGFLGRGGPGATGAGAAGAAEKAAEVGYKMTSTASKAAGAGEKVVEAGLKAGAKGPGFLSKVGGLVSKLAPKALKGALKAAGRYAPLASFVYEGVQVFRGRDELSDFIANKLIQEAEPNVLKEVDAALAGNISKDQVLKFFDNTKAWADRAFGFGIKPAAFYDWLEEQKNTAVALAMTAESPKALEAALAPGAAEAGAAKAGPWKPGGVPAATVTVPTDRNAPQVPPGTKGLPPEAGGAAAKPATLSYDQTTKQLTILNMMDPALLQAFGDLMERAKAAIPKR
jgi:nuclear transport factor 2 (NTF2) superfamily protein